MKKKYILGILAIVILVLGVSYFVLKSQTVNAPIEKNSEVGVSLSVEGIYKAKAIQVHSGETVLSLMKDLNNSDPKLNLKTKEYSGIGELVVGMGSLQNGDGQKYWQYYVNGIMPQIGADKYTLSNGDQISWSFNTSS